MLMKRNDYDSKLNQSLFGTAFPQSMSTDEFAKIVDQGCQIVSEYEAGIVLEAWMDYLSKSVNTKPEAWSFLRWFYCFGGVTLEIDNPYPFLALLFDKLGLTFDLSNISAEEEGMFEEYDLIYASLLTQSGIIDKEQFFSVDVCADEKLKAEIAKQKKKPVKKPTK